jgi:hypothetical protein
VVPSNAICLFNRKNCPELINRQVLEGFGSVSYINKKAARVLAAHFHRVVDQPGRVVVA